MLQDYINPITTKEHIAELHELLVQTIIDYAKKNNLTDIDEVNFIVNGLSGEYGSVARGKWVPSTDSSISVIGVQPEPVGIYTLLVRRLIGEHY